MTGLDGLGDTPEFAAVRSILKGARLSDDPAGQPGDDAVLLPGASGWAASVDSSVQGTHFRLDWITAEEAGGRAVRAALSDLAAVGARPRAVLIALSGPDRERLEQAGRGARVAVENEGALLVGGDLADAEGPLTIAVTVLGDLEGRPLLARTGAPAGTPLWVTGSLGAAGAALRAWSDGRVPASDLRTAFTAPTPRWREALWLRDGATVHAALDLSDGLARDAVNLARANGLVARIEADLVPIAEGARAETTTAEAALQLALSGGEDYELLIAADLPEGVPERFLEQCGVPLTRIGILAAAPTSTDPSAPSAGSASLLRSDGSETPLAGGFGHWSDS